MSLLPEFNEKFTDGVINKILNSLPFESIPTRWIKEDNFKSIRDLLNPELNPLAFDEVKGWFDRKVSERECMYHGVCSDGSYRYEIFLAKHYFIHQDGYARVSKIRPLENRISFSNLLNELSSNPLYTFCQMKGYVDL